MDVKKLFLVVEEDRFSVHEILHQISLENEEETSEKLLPYLTLFIHRQKSEQRSLRVLARRLALKITLEDLNKELPVLINQHKALNDRVRHLCQELSLKAMVIWEDDKLDSEINFLLHCHKSLDKNVRDLSEELVLRAIVKWKPVKLSSVLHFLVSCQQSGNYQARQLSHDLALKVPSRLLGKEVIYLIDRQSSENVNVRNLSWEITLNVNYSDVLENAEYIRNAQLFNTEKVSFLAKELMMRIESGEPEIQRKEELLKFLSS